MNMPKYVIERAIPGIGSVTRSDLQGIAAKSCKVLDELEGKVQWLQSFVTPDKMYCVYIAPDEASVREHARRGGFPADKVSEVKAVVDPTTAER